MNKWKYFALIAALCNASIGIFSKNIFKLGLSGGQVAFYKCLLAFLFLTVMHLFFKDKFNKIILAAKSWWKIAICAFFGVFVLYFFETSAYSHTMIPTVVFVLLGASSLTTFIMSYFVLKEKMGLAHLISFIFSTLGLFLILKENNMVLISFGGVLAAIGGIGYGLFLSFTKKLKVDTNGFSFLWWFIGFGTVYLFFPFAIHYQSPVPSLGGIFNLIFLSLIPTIGGYYCTAKALAYGEANKVQLFELSEPIFASIMGFLFIGEMLSFIQMIGGLLILIAIYIASQSERSFFIKKVKNFKT